MARYVLIVLAVVLLPGCDFVEQHGRLAYGNFEFSQGRFDRARELYEGIPVSDEPDAGGLHALRSYNLGTVDYAVGEIEDALRRWEEATASSDDDVRYRAKFNTGVLNYEQGRYESAYYAFREALLVQPEREGAKANLELAFDRWQRAGSAEAAGSVAQPGEREIEGDFEDILEQLRDREQERRRVRDEYVPPDDVDDW